MDPIYSSGLNLLKEIALSKNSGKSEEQIAIEKRHEIEDFIGRISSVNQYADIMVKIFISGINEIDEKDLERAKKLVDRHVDKSWSEESQVRINEAIIKSISSEKKVKYSGLTLLLSAATVVIGIIAHNKTKPIKIWQKR